jgi:hypothetical protein
MFSLSVLRRLGRAATALLVAFAVSPLPAKFDVSVRRGKEFGNVRSVVLYPLNCPRGIDCRILEIRLAEDLAEVGHFRVLSPAELRQLAFDRAIDPYLPGSLAALIRSLDVDAVVVGGVPGVKPEDRWTFTSPIGAKSIKPPADTPIDATTISCFGLDGRTIFEGTATGSSKRGLQIEQEIVARKFRSILKKAVE